MNSESDSSYLNRQANLNDTDNNATIEIEQPRQSKVFDRLRQIGILTDSII